MRILCLLFVATAMAFQFTSCKSGGGPATFCDTSCLKDSLKFIKSEHPLKPYVYISAANCNADSVAWSYQNMGTNRKLGIEDLLGAPVKVNKDFIKCVINDTSYAWVLFNDCASSRGFAVKLPFSKEQSLKKISSALTPFDPKFSIADNLLVYSDRGNIFAEDMMTGKTAMMTFGQRIEFDYANIHALLDSVNVTPERIWTRVKVGDEWKVIEKKIELK